MTNFGFLPVKDELAVENLISQAMDLYVLEQVAAINCSGFTDSVLPTNLETRFRRLKSLPVNRPDPVSSSKKLLSNSKSLCGNASSASTFSGNEKLKFSGNSAGKSRSLNLSVEKTRIFPEIKRSPSLNSNFEKNSRGGFRDFSDSVKICSSSSRFSGEGKMSSSRFSGESKILYPTIQTQKLLPKEKSKIRVSSSSSSFNSIDLASASSSPDLNEEGEGSKQKSKSKLSISWFDKLLPSKSMGCVWSSQTKSSLISKNTKKEFSVEEQLENIKKEISESQRLQRDAFEIIKSVKTKTKKKNNSSRF